MCGLPWGTAVTAQLALLWQLPLSSPGLDVPDGVVWTPLQVSVWPASRHHAFRRAATRSHACIHRPGPWTRTHTELDVLVNVGGGGAVSQASQGSSQP